MLSCQECEAIYQELVELVEISRRSKPAPNPTPQQLADWFEQREESQEYVERLRPALSSVKRRLIEHQRLTGHTLPLTGMPGGFTNFN
jgi:hypothetical protein